MRHAGLIELGAVRKERVSGFSRPGLKKQELSNQLVAIFFGQIGPKAVAARLGWKK
jgi:hypothetical protein